MVKFLLLILFFFIFLSCKNSNKSDPKPLNRFSVWQQIELIKDTLDVDIPIEGKLIAWRKLDLFAPLYSKVISLLVDEHDPVKKGDLLLHLWPLNTYDGYTPIEIVSPMNGIVSELYVALNDTVKNNAILLSIENRENLTLKAKVNAWQVPFIKRNSNVTFYRDDLKIKGAVLHVDRKSDWVTVIVPNQLLKINDDLFVEGQIHLKQIKGDFLPVSIFSKSDSVQIELDPETHLTIYRVGNFKDSLALIAPSLPDIKEIQIKKSL